MFKCLCGGANANNDNHNNNNNNNNNNRKKNNNHHRTKNGESGNISNGLNGTELTPHIHKSGDKLNNNNTKLHPDGIMVHESEAGSVRKPSTTTPTTKKNEDINTTTTTTTTTTTSTPLFDIYGLPPI